MDQVEKAFNGRYREVNRETQQWYTYNHPVPEPRPGMVSSCMLPSDGESLEGTSFIHSCLLIAVLLHLVRVDKTLSQCFASSVYYKCHQTARHLLFATHAGQSAEFCQRPLPDGQCNPQQTSPVEA